MHHGLAVQHDAFNGFDQFRRAILDIGESQGRFAANRHCRAAGQGAGRYFFGRQGGGGQTQKKGSTYGNMSAITQFPDWSLLCIHDLNGPSHFLKKVLWKDVQSTAFLKLQAGLQDIRDPPHQAAIAVAPSPANFELVFEIVSGNNPELRKRFLELGETVTPANLDALAEEFLPHHFGDAIYDKSSSSIRSELNVFQSLVSGSQERLTGYSTKLTSVVDRLDKIDPKDASAIRTGIDGVVKATNEQNALAKQILEKVGRRLASIDGLSKEMDDLQRAKFLHAATGLENRRGFNKRMAELFTTGLVPRNCTLVIGSIARFAMFQQPESLKAREMILGGFGACANKIMQPADFGFWLETPEMAFLVDSLDEDAVRAFIERLRKGLTQQFVAVGCTPPALERLAICFGAANTRSSESAAGLIRNSEAALATAVASGLSHTVFYTLIEKVGEGRNYELYGRGEMAV